MIEKRVTIYDIAEKACVSVGTVNRALNGKDRISEQTRQNILKIAKELGYTVNPAAQGLRRAPITIGAILFCPIDEYVDAIIEGIEHTAKTLEKYRVSVDIQKIPYTNRNECINKTVRLLREFEEAEYNGIVLFMSSMLDELDEISKIIAEFSEKRIPVATVANDFSDARVLHVGVDAGMAGEMAAELLQMTCAGGAVALLVTSKTSPINMQYISGFERHADAFSEIRIYEHFDDRNKIASVMEQMLSEVPNLSGVYMATASSTMACEYMKEHSDITVITTDLLVETPRLLSERVSNAVIFQNPYKQGKNVIRAIYEHIIGNATEPVQLIIPQILLSSNVQAYLKRDE